jgi:hypothetical protein
LDAAPTPSFQFLDSFDSSKLEQFTRGQIIYFGMGKRSRSQGRGELDWYLILALSRITIQKKYKVKEAKSYILK